VNQNASATFSDDKPINPFVMCDDDVELDLSIDHRVLVFFVQFKVEFCPVNEYIFTL